MQIYLTSQWLSSAPGWDIVSGSSHLPRYIVYQEPLLQAAVKSSFFRLLSGLGLALLIQAVIFRDHAWNILGPH